MPVPPRAQRCVTERAKGSAKAREWVTRRLSLDETDGIWEKTSFHGMTIFTSGMSRANNKQLGW